MKTLKVILVLIMLALGAYLAIFRDRPTVVINNGSGLVFEENTDVPPTEEQVGMWEDENADLYTITYKLDGIDDEAVRSDMDRFISDRVSSFKTEGGLENLTESDKEALGFNRGLKYTLDFSYDLKESSTITTYLLKVGVYTGGAHGNLEIISFNYDVESGQRLNLSDIFSASPQVYLPRLQEKGEAFLESEYESAGYPEGLDARPANWSVWYATDSELVFVFQPYQILPYAAGAPEIRVPVSELSDVIDPDYFAA